MGVTRVHIGVARVTHWGNKRVTHWGNRGTHWGNKGTHWGNKGTHWGNKGNKGIRVTIGVTRVAVPLLPYHWGNKGTCTPMVGYQYPNDRVTVP